MFMDWYIVLGNPSATHVWTCIHTVHTIDVAVHTVMIDNGEGYTVRELKTNDHNI